MRDYEAYEASLKHYKAILAKEQELKTYLLLRGWSYNVATDTVSLIHDNQCLCYVEKAKHAGYRQSLAGYFRIDSNFQIEEAYAYELGKFKKKTFWYSL